MLPQVRRCGPLAKRGMPHTCLRATPLQVTRTLILGLPVCQALYFQALKDADGATLNGAANATYTLTFSAEPPAGAFWSVTMCVRRPTPAAPRTLNPGPRWSCAVGGRRGKWWLRGYQCTSARAVLYCNACRVQAPHSCLQSTEQQPRMRRTFQQHSTPPCPALHCTFVWYGRHATHHAQV